MARPVRKTRRSSQPTTDASTGANSAVISGTSTPVAQNSSPGTTPVVDEKSAPKPRSVRSRAKRLLTSDSELSELNNKQSIVAPAKKRRGNRSNVIIELSTRSNSSRASSVSLASPAIKKAQKLSQKAKGKHKAVSKPSSSTGNTEYDDLLEDESGLDFDDFESAASASEFEASDIEDDEDDAVSINISPRRITRRNKLAHAEMLELDSDDLDDDDFDEDPANSELAIIAGAAENDDEEAADLQEAIQASLVPRSKGKSGNISASRASLAALRASAAEKRLSKMQIVDDAATFGDNIPLSSESDNAADSEDLDGSGSDLVTTKKQKKQKKKVKGKAITLASTNSPRSMTISELRQIRRETKAEQHRINAPLRSKERSARARLGRKLTHAERSTVALYMFHPELEHIWGDLEAEIIPNKQVPAKDPPGFKATLLPFQRESVSWMRAQEASVWAGGVLADEMGMGKTVQMLALLSSDRRKPNLIVAPTVAIIQWRNEIEAHTTGFTVSVWHGSSREKNYSDLKKFDVVLTTYAVLESAFRKQEKGFVRKGVIMSEKSPIHQIKWARIILDEAHNIKERSTNTAKGAFELKGKFKWCLSGTPLQNRVGELYSLIRFLGGDPFAYYFCKRCDCKSLHWKFSNKRSCDDCGHTPMMHTCLWNNEILTPIQKHAFTGPGKDAFKRLKILLDRMMLRRTKIERADDLGLPPRTIIVRRDYFSPEEKELYASLFSDAKRSFSTYVNTGTLLNNYSNIFSLLTRMRQMACHPDLVLKSRRNTDFSGDIVEATVCRICHDVAEDAIKSSCHHIFDRTCIQQYLDACGQDMPACPVCHIKLSIDLEAPAIEQDDKATSKARQGILGRLDHRSWRSSTKIEALVEELEELRHRNSTTKSIVFSQFVNFLDLIAWRLQKAGFAICRLEGTMTPQARDATIKHFMNNVEVTVFLVSLKAGGVALNLTEASRVYLMDSWWNPAVEFQAMDRIHRLGQYRPVHAIKLVVQDSIEERIVQLQEKKSAMVDATLSSDDSAMGRLTAEDLGFLFSN